MHSEHPQYGKHYPTVGRADHIVVTHHRHLEQPCAEAAAPSPTTATQIIGESWIPASVAEYHKGHAKCATWALCVLTGALTAALGVAFYLVGVEKRNDDMNACLAGCSQRGIVCGLDGFYYDSCVAHCSHVKLAGHMEICGESPLVRPIDIQQSAHSNISSLMSRHDDRGFKFIGFQNHESDPITVNLPNMMSKYNLESSAPTDAATNGTTLKHLYFDEVKSSLGYMSQVGHSLSHYLPSVLEPYLSSQGFIETEASKLIPTESWMIIDGDDAVYIKHASVEQSTTLSEKVKTESAFKVERDILQGNPHGCGVEDHTKEDIYSLQRSKLSENSHSSKMKLPPKGDDGLPIPPKPFNWAKTSNADGESGGADGHEPPRRLAVLGYDSRTKVSDEEIVKAPYRYLGQFGPVGCSGTLIGPSHVLTAAHCLWARGFGISPMQNSDHGDASGQWMGSNYFYAARTAEDKYLGKAKVARKIIHRSYKNLDADEFLWDIGLAELETPLGNQLGWMGLEYDCGGTGEVELTLAGYPADKPRFTMYEDTCSRIPSACNRRSIPHNCDSYGGQSGSAMFHQNEQGEYVVRAVHVAGSSELNRATLIQPETFRAVKEWRSPSETLCN